MVKFARTDPDDTSIENPNYVCLAQSAPARGMSFAAFPNEITSYGGQIARGLAGLGAVAPSPVTAT